MNGTKKTGMNGNDDDGDDDNNVPIVAICGGGIIGLTLALSLKHYIPYFTKKLIIYEKAHEFVDDVGAGMGLYPNGLRVLYDIGINIPEDIAIPYQYRQWVRHDGTVIAQADESILVNDDIDNNNNENDENKKDADENIKKFQPVGIRRWKFQKILYDEVIKAGIQIQFNKAIQNIQSIDNDNDNNNDNSNNENGNKNNNNNNKKNNKQQKKKKKIIRMEFHDGTIEYADIVFGTDGGKSTIRNCIFGNEHKLQYTGTTCLMGISKISRTGICFPAAESNTHGVFFPTGKDEQCFQFHVQIPEKFADNTNWGNLSDIVTKEECHNLVTLLKNDGWNDEYLIPLLPENVINAVRIGFCLLQPPLNNFVDPTSKRIILLGDAAHPPVPYIGQGAQAGLEDCGILSLLLQHYCGKDNNNNNNADNNNWEDNINIALRIYEQLRIPRTKQMLERSKKQGHDQTIRASNNQIRKHTKEELIQRNVFFHQTLPILLPGTQYNYKAAVYTAIQDEPLIPVQEENEEEQEEEIVNSNKDEEEVTV